MANVPDPDKARKVIEEADDGSGPGGRGSFAHLWRIVLDVMLDGSGKRASREDRELAHQIADQVTAMAITERLLAHQNPSRAELRDVNFVQSAIRESIDAEFKQKVAAIELKPGPIGKVPTVEHFKRDLAANLTTVLLLDDEGECGCPHENPAGRFTDKGERMYQAIKDEYEAKGDPRAAEIAARTVYAEHKKGTPGLLNVGAGRPPGVPNPGRFRRL